MSGGRRSGAPVLLRLLVGIALRVEERAPQLSDLDELFDERVRRIGSARATLWYVRQVLSFWSRLGIERMRRGLLRARGPNRAQSGAQCLGRDRLRRAGYGRSGWDSLSWDMRHAVRALWRRPGYTLAATLTLGVGIAGSVAVFSVANWVLLRPVPGVRAPGELATVRLESTEFNGGGYPISHPDLLDLTGTLEMASGVTAVAAQEVHIAVGDAAPERVPAQIVTASYFDVLGVVPVAGRGFVGAEDEEGAAVAVIAEALRRRYGAGELEPGSELLVNGRSYRVVGVAPAGFRGAELPGMTQLWFPAGALPVLISDPDALGGRGRQVWSNLIARLRPGASLAQVESRLTTAVEDVRRTHTDHSFLATRYAFRAHAGIGLAPELRDSVMRTLGLLGAASALLLLLSCANAANLGLTRAHSLRNAVLVRRALGASTGRLARERLVESLVVGVTGSLAGVALGAAAVRAFEGASLSRGLGVLEDVALDVRVLLFSVLLSLVAGSLAGLVPALAASRDRWLAALRATRHGERRTVSVRNGLVVAQIALSIVLVVGAGLLERTLWNLRSIDAGVVTNEVLTFDVDPGLQGYEGGRVADYVREVLGGLTGVAGVGAAGAAFVGAYESFYIPLWAMRLGGTREQDGVAPRSFHVAGDFFQTLGLRLSAGRFFEPGEMAARDNGAPHVVVLNEAAARAFFPELDPSQVPGQHLQRAVSGDRRNDPVRPITVVGVVHNARLGEVAEAGEKYAFLPWGQGYQPRWASFYVRTANSPGALAPAVRAVLRGIDASLPLFALGPLRLRMEAQLVQQRFVATLSLLLGLLGLGLATLGAYAVLAYSVAQRTRELGIRSALGAAPARIVRLVVRDGLVLCAIGVALGISAAAWLSRFLEARLFGVGRLDVATYASGALLMLAVALLACVLPGRRAARVDPLAALRQE